MDRYERFSLTKTAQRGENYLTSMVDEEMGFLPYWYIEINAKPAYARHVRVDDAELVASWYEALSCTMKLLGSQADARDGAVLNGFKTHLLSSWGERGLRFHQPYPWSNTLHCSFHEMGWVLSGLNRLLEDEPDNAQAEQRAAGLVRGLRGLVYQRKIKTFWNGDYPLEESILEFPSDLYIAGQGFVPERVTGRGEQSIRNAVLIHPLAVRAERTGDPEALALAVGLTNHLLGISRYFNYKGAFFGHVHSALWSAMGVIRLGRITKNAFYIRKGREIYEYVKGLSSGYGWVPEYAQWHPMEEEHCETCCIRDMIECALELIDCGYDEWELINRFTRNQLAQQQFTYAGFVAVDNSRADADGKTWKDMDKRVIGGWSGGGDANSLSITKFRSIAGCCVGTAPQALYAVYSRVDAWEDGRLTIQLPMDKEDALVKMTTAYPNEGKMTIRVKKAADVYIRPYDFMGTRLDLRVNGASAPCVYRDGMLYLPNMPRGAEIELRHPMETIVKAETVQGKELHVHWRGADVIRITPDGEHLRLYQRDLSLEKTLPAKEGAAPGKIDLGPTQQTR